MEFMPGDIFSTKGKGITGWLSSHLLLPKTDRFHFGIIARYLEDEDDYIIYESIGKGVTVGLLSFYEGEDLEVYRVKDVNARKLGERAVVEITRLGRAHYDYKLILELILFALKNPKLLLPALIGRPISYSQLPYKSDERYICTEAANEAWKQVGHPIITPGYAPVPAGFKDAQNLGRIELIWNGIWREVVSY